MKYSHQQNMKLVIFDFDGTIADTSGGILDSHRFALSAMGREIPTAEELRSVIGGNLLNTYIERFGFAEPDAREAVRIYRERYAEVGIHKAVLYPGFADMVKELKNKGYKVGVATLKAENFAKTMLDEIGIADYFDEVCGMDQNDGLDKAGLILKCCDLCGCGKNEATLVGDSNNDFIGAKQAGVDFIGVTYGFGFNSGKKYEFKTVNSCAELLELLINPPYSNINIVKESSVLEKR